jgi:hypothetical protein
VGIELPVALITIAGKAEEGNQFILLLEAQRPEDLVGLREILDTDLRGFPQTQIGENHVDL